MPSEDLEAAGTPIPARTTRDKILAGEAVLIESRIEMSGGQFVVIHSFEEVADKCDTEDPAKRSVEQREKEDAMYETGG